MALFLATILFSFENEDPFVLPTVENGHLLYLPTFQEW